MYSRVVILGIALCAGAPTARAQAPAKPIFRHVALARDTLWLGRPLGAFDRFARHPDDTLVTVPLGEFGGTDAIQVERSRTGRVTAFTFLYGMTHNLDELRDNYLRELGPPADQVQDSVAGIARRVWIWRDSQTEFLLAAFSAPLNGALGAARLSDRTSSAP